MVCSLTPFATAQFVPMVGREKTEQAFCPLSPSPDSNRSPSNERKRRSSHENKVPNHDTTAQQRRRNLAGPPLSAGSLRVVSSEKTHMRPEQQQHS